MGIESRTRLRLFLLILTLMGGMELFQGDWVIGFLVFVTIFSLLIRNTTPKGHGVGMSGE